MVVINLPITDRQSLLELKLCICNCHILIRLLNLSSFARSNCSAHLEGQGHNLSPDSDLRRIYKLHFLFKNDHHLRLSSICKVFRLVCLVTGLIGVFIFRFVGFTLQLTLNPTRAAQTLIEFVLDQTLFLLISSSFRMVSLALF